MRLFWLCLIFLSSYAEVQRAQIIQTYIYETKEGDFKQEKKDKKILLILQSNSLIQFINGTQTNLQPHTQVVKFNEGYTEFKGITQNLYTYSNATNAKLKFNLSQIIYDLQNIDSHTYIIKNAIYPIKDISKCKVIIQKTLTSLIDGKKDFVINLDNQHYFSKVLATYKFLQCARE